MADINPIYVQFLHNSKESLKGLVHKQALLVGSVIDIDGTSHTIVSRKLVTFKFYPAQARLIISDTHEPVTDQERIKKILNNLGIPSIQQFLNLFFTNPIFEGAHAHVELYFHGFYKDYPIIAGM